MVEVRQGTLTWMVVVEVRQGAGGEETRRGDEERRGEERRGGGEKEDEKREEKEEDEDDEEDEEDEEEATDIKSNNPHLAGGELRYDFETVQDR